MTDQRSGGISERPSILEELRELAIDGVILHDRLARIFRERLLEPFARARKDGARAVVEVGFAELRDYLHI